MAGRPPRLICRDLVPADALQRLEVVAVALQDERPTPRVTVWVEDGVMPGLMQRFAAVTRGNRIHVAATALRRAGRLTTWVHERAGVGNVPPEAADYDGIVYVLAHEWGHVHGARDEASADRYAAGLLRSPTLRDRLATPGE